MDDVLILSDAAFPGHGIDLIADVGQRDSDPVAPDLDVARPVAERACRSPDVQVTSSTLDLPARVATGAHDREDRGHDS